MRKWMKGLRLKIALLTVVPGFVLAVVGHSAVDWLQDRAGRIETLSILQMNRLHLLAKMQSALHGMSEGLGDGSRADYRKERAAFEAALGDFARLPAAPATLLKGLEDDWGPLRERLDLAEREIPETTPGAADRRDESASRALRAKVFESVRGLQSRLTAVSGEQLDTAARAASLEVAASYRSATRTMMMVIGGLILFALSGAAFVIWLERDLSRFADELNLSRLDSSLVSRRVERLFENLRAHSGQQSDELKAAAENLRGFQEESATRRTFGEALSRQGEKNLLVCEDAEKNLAALLAVLSLLASSSEENRQRLEGVLQLAEQAQADLHQVLVSAHKTEEMIRWHRLGRARDIRPLVETLEKAAERSADLAQQEWSVDGALKERLFVAERRLLHLIHGRHIEEKALDHSDHLPPMVAKAS